MFQNKEFSYPRKDQIFFQQLSTYRKINALKQTQLGEDELQNNFIFQHLRWIENNGGDQKQNSQKINKIEKKCKRIDRSQLKSSYPMGIRRQEKKSPSNSIASSRLGYRRGHKIQRDYFQTLINQLQQLEETIPSIEKMNSTQILQYRKKHIDSFFNLFFKQTQSQCFEKSLFLTKIYLAFQTIVTQIFQKLYRQLLMNQKCHLADSILLHKDYQQRIQNLNSLLRNKDDKIQMFSNNFDTVSKKNQYKTKKNKNLSISLIKAGQTVIQVEKQRNCLRSEYLKMLTIGFQGGMSHEQAEAHIIQKLLIRQNTPNFSGLLKSNMHGLKQTFYPQQFKINSNSQTFQRKPTKKQTIQSNDKIVQCKNQRIQVCLQNMNIESHGVNFSYHEKYKNSLLKNTQTQTISPKDKKTITYDKSVQYQYQKEIEIKKYRQKSINKSLQDIYSVKDLSKETIELQDSVKQLLLNGEEDKILCQLKQFSYGNQCRKKKQQQQSEVISNHNSNHNSNQNSNKNSNKNSNQTQHKQQDNIFDNIKITKKNVSKKRKTIAPSNFKRENNNGSKQLPPRASNFMGRRHQNKMSLNIQKNYTEASQQTKKQISRVDQRQNSDIPTQQTPDSSPQVSQKQQDYQKTDMLSVIQNMQNISPNGVYIDETMMFLLKKSLFRVKHDSNYIGKNKIYKRNSKIISQIRLSTMGQNQRRKTLCLISLKNVSKLISLVYESAYSMLWSSQILGQEYEQKKEKPGSKQINLIDLLKQAIYKEYPGYRNNPKDTDNKLCVLLKSMQCYSISNYMVKNFLLLSCLDSNVYSPIIFTSDIKFYIGLIRQLAVNKGVSALGHKSSYSGNMTISTNSGASTLNNNYSSHHRKSQNFQNICLMNFQTCYTTVSKLKFVLEEYITQHFQKQQLLTSITKKINEILPGFDNDVIQGNTRLDIYKCSQLIIQAILTFKIQLIKSYSKLAYVPDITPRSLMSEQLLLDLLGFMRLPKLSILNILNKFRYSYGKKNTINGISLINFVTFCLVNNFPDFDVILINIRKYSILPHGITLKQIQNHPKLDKVGKIALYSYQYEIQNKKQIFIGAAKLIHSKIVEIESAQILEKILGESLTSLYISNLCCMEEKREYNRKSNFSEYQ